MILMIVSICILVLIMFGFFWIGSFKHSNVHVVLIIACVAFVFSIVALATMITWNLVGLNWITMGTDMGTIIALSCITEDAKRGA